MSTGQIAHLRFKAKRQRVTWCQRCERMLQGNQEWICRRIGHVVLEGRAALVARRKAYPRDSVVLVRRERRKAI